MASIPASIDEASALLADHGYIADRSLATDDSGRPFAGCRQPRLEEAREERTYGVPTVTVFFLVGQPETFATGSIRSPKSDPIRRLIVIRKSRSRKGQQENPYLAL